MGVLLGFEFAPCGLLCCLRDSCGAAVRELEEPAVLGDPTDSILYVYITSAIEINLVSQSKGSA
jgi:hypothetical protein